MSDSKVSALPPNPSFYSNIDPVNDSIPIVDNTNSTLKRTNRNNFLELTSAPVSINDTQTLTNKTLTAPTISSPIFSGTITGIYTIGGTPTFPATVVTLTGSQTLTNKILTSPTINAPTITNASMTADAITGFSTANTGTIYGVAITGGLIGTAGLATNAVQANQLATSAITLGFTSVTTNQGSITSTTAIQATGLTATVTIPAGNRRVEVIAHLPAVSLNTIGTIYISLWDGTVGSGGQLQEDGFTIGGNTYLAPFHTVAYVTPAAGSKTYNVGVRVSTGTAILNFGSSAPGTLIVKAI